MMQLQKLIIARLQHFSSWLGRGDKVGSAHSGAMLGAHHWAQTLTAATLDKPREIHRGTSCPRGRASGLLIPLARRAPRTSRTLLRSAFKIEVLARRDISRASQPLELEMSLVDASTRRVIRHAFQPGKLLPVDGARRCRGVGAKPIIRRDARPRCRASAR